MGADHDHLEIEPRGLDHTTLLLPALMLAAACGDPERTSSQGGAGSTSGSSFATAPPGPAGEGPSGQGGAGPGGSAQGGSGPDGRGGGDVARTSAASATSGVSDVSSAESATSSTGSATSGPGASSADGASSAESSSGQGGDASSSGGGGAPASSAASTAEQSGAATATAATTTAASSGGGATGTMSFFVSSVGNGDGDFGGLAGVDLFCQNLAAAVGAGNRTWRAYVSTSSSNARDRIGSGPWFDAGGSLVATDVASLHAQGIVHERMRTETGGTVPNGETNPGANEHDVLTGSSPDGTFSGASCGDFSSSSPDSAATVGHCDASFTAAGGTSPVGGSDNWNASHSSVGCDAASLFTTGSSARVYCFAL